MPGLRKRGPDDPPRRDRGIGCLMRWKVVQRPNRENPKHSAADQPDNRYAPTERAYALERVRPGP